MLGDAARDDHELTDLLTRLRRNANWSYFTPTRRRLRDRFDRRLRTYIDRAEPESLAGLVATHGDHGAVARQQVPQWLFAFDPAGIASIRTLALLAAHPDHAAHFRDELIGRDLAQPQDLPYLRACVLESLRLWPTTPGVLRDTVRPTTWETGTLPAGTAVLIYAPLFHRDTRALSYADRFAPDVWLQEPGTDDWPLIPFSAGPAACPGRNLVLLSTSTMLATLLERDELTLDPPDRLAPQQPLPGTFSPYRLRFTVAEPHHGGH